MYYEILDQKTQQFSIQRKKKQLMKKGNSKNKQNLIKEVKKKFHYQPPKDYQTRTRLSIKSRNNSLHGQKNYSESVSSVQPEKQSNQCEQNESSWLSKLVHNMSEASNVDYEECFKRKNKSIGEAKRQKLINTEQKNVYTIERKSSLQTKPIRSNLCGKIKLGNNPIEIKKKNISQSDQVSTGRALTENYQTGKKSFAQDNQKQESSDPFQKSKTSINNYSTINADEQDQIISFSEEIKENNQISFNMGIQKKNTKVGGIKKNKRSFVEENPCLTLEDIEALTIKKKDEIQKNKIEGKQNSFFNKLQLNEEQKLSKKIKENENRRKYKYDIDIETKPLKFSPSNQKEIIREKKPRIRNFSKYEEYSQCQRFRPRKDEYLTQKEPVKMRKNIIPIYEQKMRKQTQIPSIKNYKPLFPETSPQISLHKKENLPNKGPYLEMPSIPLEEYKDFFKNSKKDIEQNYDLGTVIDNINRKLTKYIEANHLQTLEQKLHLNFDQLRINNKY